MYMAYTWQHGDDLWLVCLRLLGASRWSDVASFWTATILDPKNAGSYDTQAIPDGTVLSLPYAPTS